MRAPLPIPSIAEQLGLTLTDYEPYGWHKAKLALGLRERLAGRPQGKYVLVTSTNPTLFGEGKTVSSIALGMALSKLGARAVTTIRQPSLGPVFGRKGGGAGGGESSLLPAEDINLHFTGDVHAVTSANNLLAAMLDNHVKRGKEPKVEPESITWKRVLDMNDRGLAAIETGLDDPPQAPRRKTGFQLTAASEVMAILALAQDLSDLRARLGRIVVGWTPGGEPVTAEQIGCAGAMAALLRDAIRPNLVQTCEHTPALVHAGPFANIAHGNSSILADQIALRLADYVVTESGFGADCGAEKLFHIKCRGTDLWPDAVVLISTVRALKLHSGRHGARAGRALPPELFQEDLDALRAGAANLQAHLEIVRKFGLSAIVAVNRFPTDTDAEVRALLDLAVELGAAEAAEMRPFTEGSAGTLDVARAVMRQASNPAEPRFLYELGAPIEQKLEALAQQVYGADGVDLSDEARASIARIERQGLGGVPVCVAKTQYSLSHDSSLLGRPSGYHFPIRELRLANGAGFVYALAGDMRTMPGLPSEPAALQIDVDADGRITGV